MGMYQSQNHLHKYLPNGDIIYADGVRYTTKPKQKNGIADIVHVVIDKPTINGDQISTFEGEYEHKKFIYRPQTLNEYIGQENAKSLIELNIKKIERLKPVHFLISGSRGHGKTTLAYIIKNLLKAKMIERIAKQIVTNDDIIALINEINTSTEKNIILFIDEIHSLDQALCEIFYPIMEDFKLAGKPVKPFILIGATTERHILVKHNAPFVDRFQVQVALQHYKPEDIKKIITQYKDQLYSEYNIDENYINIVAENSKLTPRIAISLLEDGIIETDINHVLKCHRIVYKGLNETDVAILRILYQNNQPMGAKSLSQMIGISEKDYMEEYESYLVEQELILRTARGRTIAKLGQEVYNHIQRKVKL